MFMIKWKQGSFDKYGSVTPIITGISRFSTQTQAQNQIDIWKQHFPSNTYYICPL